MNFSSPKKILATSIAILFGVVAANGTMAWLTSTTFQRAEEAKKAIIAAQTAGGRLGKARAAWQEVENQAGRLQEALVTHESLLVLLGDLERLGEEEGIVLFHFFFF